MAGWGGSGGEGPSPAEDEAPGECLPFGGEGMTAWRDREGPDGRGT